MKSGGEAALDSPWRLASISKQITAVLVMMSIEKGQLKLDTPIADILPAYADLPNGKVTIRALLEHTSGLPDPSETSPNSDGIPKFYLNDRADHAFCRGTLRSTPGEFHYNNCDYYVLADVLEKVTGDSFSVLLHDRISGPLGLRTLHLYRPGEPEVFKAVDEHGVAEPKIVLSSYEGAGGMSASAADLLAFDQALMAGRLLSADSLKVLWKGERSLGYVALGAWAYTVKPSGCSAPLTLVERRGNIGDVQVLNLMWPARQASLIVFSNTSATDWGSALARQRLHAGFGGRCLV
jgi:CubicO group peptidase (beta-lactamase class C family)